MIVKVGEHKLEIVKSPVNELEVNITKVQFEFPSSMDGLVKEAYFTLGEHTYKQIINNNECDIPNEVLVKKGDIELGVVAFEVQDEETLKRYNPSPCHFNTWVGSLKEADNTEPITPTDKEQIEQAITNLQNGKQDLLISGENIKTINNESLLGSGNLEVITDLSDYYTKEQTNDLLDTKQDKSSMNEYYKKTETYSDDEVDTLLSEYTKTSDLSSVALSNDYDDLDDKPDLSVYSLITETGNKIDLEINSSTYVLTAKLYDKNNNLISTSTGIDLPLETMVVGASYDSATKEIILTLKNGQEVRFSVADLVSGLQTEITSDNMLSSDLVDDTNHTHKFVSSSDITNWNNKSDFSGSYNDLSNKPTIPTKTSDLTNDSNFEVNTNKVVSISSSSNDTQYPSAKCVYDSQEEQDTQIEQLQEENTYLNSIIDQLPRVNGTGDTITLNNTIEAKMKCNLSPSGMEQKTTTGVQLFNKDTSVENTSFISSYSYSDGVYTIIPTGTGNPKISLKINLQSGSYTLNSATYLSIATQIRNINDTLLQNFGSNYEYRNFTLSETGVMLVFNWANPNNTTPFKLDLNTLLIVSGTYTSSTMPNYEKYSGGIPAPNPQFPQDIHTTTGDNVIRDEGKNLIYSSTRNRNLLYLNGATTSTDYVFKAGTYTISFVNSNNVSVYVKTASTEATRLGSETTKTFTLNEDFNLWFYRSGLTDNEVTNIQLEKGTSSSNYEPYNKTDYPLTLGNLEYSKIGNYEDEFIYNTTDTNLELNKWYLKKNIGKVVLDGSEEWGIGNIKEEFSSFYVLQNDLKPATQVLSNYFKYDEPYYIIQSFRTGITTHGSLPRIYISIPSSLANTTAQFKTWLSNNNTIVDYIRANPEYILLNETLQEQLTNIYNNMMSKKGTTNISQVANDLPMVISASALLDLNTLVGG